MEKFIEKVASVQNELNAPKSQYNSFGKYHYRNCEDILEAFKKLSNGLVLTVNDDLVMVGDRYYIKATATITDGKNTLSNSAFAREDLSKKGMDVSQLTGSTSSYARKYALNGLLCIDDNKDADSMDNTNAPAQNQQQPSNNDALAELWYNTFEQDKAAMIEAIRNGETPDGIIKSLTDKGYAINKKTREQIKRLSR